MITENTLASFVFRKRPRSQGMLYSSWGGSAECLVVTIDGHEGGPVNLTWYSDHHQSALRLPVDTARAIANELRDCCNAIDGGDADHQTDCAALHMAIDRAADVWLSDRSAEVKADRLTYLAEQLERAVHGDADGGARRTAWRAAWMLRWGAGALRAEIEAKREAETEDERGGRGLV